MEVSGIESWAEEGPETVPERVEGGPSDEEALDEQAPEVANSNRPRVTDEDITVSPPDASERNAHVSMTVGPLGVAPVVLHHVRPQEATTDASEPPVEKEAEPATSAPATPERVAVEEPRVEAPEEDDQTEPPKEEPQIEAPPAPAELGEDAPEPARQTGGADDGRPPRPPHGPESSSPADDEDGKPEKDAAAAGNAKPERPEAPKDTETRPDVTSSEAKADDPAKEKTPLYELDVPEPDPEVEGFEDDIFTQVHFMFLQAHAPAPPRNETGMFRGADTVLFDPSVVPFSYSEMPVVATAQSVEVPPDHPNFHVIEREETAQMRMFTAADNNASNGDLKERATELVRMRVVADNVRIQEFVRRFELWGPSRRIGIIADVSLAPMVEEIKLRMGISELVQAKIVIPDEVADIEGPQVSAVELAVQEMRTRGGNITSSRVPSSLLDRVVVEQVFSALANDGPHQPGLSPAEKAVRKMPDEEVSRVMQRMEDIKQNTSGVLPGFRARRRMVALVKEYTERAT
jgi:hypothetical protein